MTFSYLKYSFNRVNKNYSLHFLRRDLVSGLSVALLALPQSIAYALLLGLPIQSGIIAAVFGAILTSTFGHSHYLIAGPTNATCLLLQAGTSQILFNHFKDTPSIQRGEIALVIISQIILCAALMQILIGALKLGRLTQFISRSVMMGYLLGIAVTIFITQSYHILSVESPEGVYSLFSQCVYLIRQLHNLNPLSLLVGLLGILMLFGLKKISKRIPRHLIMLGLTSAITLYLNKYITHFSPWNISTIEAPLFSLKGLFGFHFSFYENGLINDILMIALAISLLSIFELNSITRLISEKKGQPVNTNRDVLALGLSNFLTSFFLGALPSSGSPTRTTFNYRSGAVSRLSGIFCGLFILIILSIFYSTLHYIPKSALAALLIVIGFEMIDFKLLKICLNTTKRDASVLIITCLSCFFLQLNIALFVGIALSLIFYLRLAANTVVLEYAFTEEGHFRPIDSQHKRLDSRIRIINMEGNLFFGSIDSLQKKLGEITKNKEVRSIILRFNNVHHLDASICHYLEILAINLMKQGKNLYLSEVLKPTAGIIEQSTVWRALAQDYLYEKDFDSPVSATKKAYEHALAHLDMN